MQQRFRLPLQSFFEEEREVEKRKKGKKAEGGNTIHHQDITLAPLSLVREQRRRRKNERGKEENKKSEKKSFLKSVASVLSNSDDGEKRVRKKVGLVFSRQDAF